MNFANAKSITIPEGSVKKITSNGVTLWEKITSRIPSEYQEVEWIQAGSSVGAYLNLGFTFDTAARVNLGMYRVDTSTSYIFGAAENSGKYRCMISAPYGETKAYGYGSDGSTYLSIAVSFDDGFNDFEFTLKDGSASIKNLTNGKSDARTTNKAFTMTSNLLLFAQNYNGSARYGAYRKVAYFQYYDKTDTLICDLVPCYRKSDNVIGMYDIVRKTFLTNVGTGSFTKGANVV